MNMNTSKRLLSLLLSLALIFSLGSPALTARAEETPEETQIAETEATEAATDPTTGTEVPAAITEATEAAEATTDPTEETAPTEADPTEETAPTEADPTEETDSEENYGISLTSDGGDTNVATVTSGETTISYGTLAAAISAATDSTETTITLVADVTEDVVIPSEKTITLKLDGHKITNSSSHTITNYGTLTITGTGTVDNVTNGKAAVVNYGTAYLYGGTYERSAEAGTSSSVSGSNSYYTIKNYNQMTIGNSSDAVTVSNSGCYSSCIANGYQNSSDKASAQATTGTVTPTLIINGASVSGGIATIKNDDEATLTINGGTFTNTNGMVVQNHSTATITGGTFTGSTYAVYNCGCDATSDKGVLTISGGTFTGAYALADVSTANTASVAVSAGEFTGTTAAIGTSANTTAGFSITGGTYSSDVSTYYDTSIGYTAVKDASGNYTVVTTADVTSTAVASITSGDTTTYYSSLGAAVADVPVGTSASDLGAATTITILCDINNAEGITVPSYVNLTIDFNNHTYTLTGPGAGSTGTETQGFQLLKDSTIVMKNGTIKIAEGANNIKRIIQSYANVTLTDMIFYSANQVGGEDLCLSFNNGTVTFTGKTSVYSSDNSANVVAFDVYYWSSGYPNGTTVKFDTDYTGTIDGYILYDTSDSTKATLTINGNGTFNGGIKLSSDSTTAAETAASQISITGGTFSTDVTAYCANGYAAVYNSTNYTIQEGVAGIYDSDDNCVAVYETLAEAIAAVGSDQTIKLITDIAVESTITISVDVAIDLNGYMLSSTMTGTVFSVGASATLAIQDSSESASGSIDITSDGDVTFANGAGETSTVKVTNATINVTSTGGKAVLIWYSGVDISGGTFNVSGTDTTNTHGIYAKAGSISGGTFTVTAGDSAVASAKLVSFSSANGSTFAITGGTYNVSPYTGYLATGYGVTDNGDGTYTVSSKIVATVTIDGETESVTSIFTAISRANNATSNATITLAVDIELASTLTINNTNGRAVTLDLNGHTITTAESFTGSNVFAVKSTFTITDGSTNQGGSITVSSSTIVDVIDNASTLTISGGTIAFTSTYDSASVSIVKNESGATVTVSGEAVLNAAKATNDSGTKSVYGISDKGGTIILSGGSITVSSSVGEADGISGQGSTTVVTLSGTAITVSTTASSANAAGIWNAYTTMTGGVITVTADSGTAYGVYGKQSSGSVDSTISGGYVSVSGATNSCISGQVAVSGGYFSHTPANFLAADYAVYGYSSTIYPYTVAESGKGVAQIGSTQYLTLAEAVAVANAATEATTITLLSSVSLDSVLLISNSSYTVTIDLNGKNLTINSGVTLTVSEGTEIVIVDSAATQGLVTNNGTIAVGGTLDIRDLGYTTDGTSGGLLGQQSGQISISATGTFIAPDVWETYWGSYGAWDPSWSTAAHIFSTVEAGATVYSFGKGWTCVNGFTGTDGYASGTTYWKESGTYLVEYFKTSRGGDGIEEETATTWTYPAAVTENTIFAGWYDSDGNVYSGTSGVAYAKFVTLCEDWSTEGVHEAAVINFLGGGLSAAYNSDTSDYSTISMRFGYDIIIPTGCDNTDSYSWSWEWTIEGASNTWILNGQYWADSENSYGDNACGETIFCSNLVITGVPSSFYDKNIYSTLIVRYTTADGTTVTAKEGSTQSRSVNQIVNCIEQRGEGASTYEKSIVAGINALSCGE